VDSKSYYAFKNYELKIGWSPLETQVSASRKVDIKWDEDSTTILDAKLFVEAEPDGGSAGLKLHMNSENVFETIWQPWEDNKRGDTVNVMGLLVNGSNKFDVTIWKHPLPYPFERKVVVTAYVAITYEGKEPSVTPIDWKYYLAGGLALGGIAGAVMARGGEK